MTTKWELLKAELEYLGKQGVTSIHPLLVLGYMSYIEQLQVGSLKEEED